MSKKCKKVQVVVTAGIKPKIELLLLKTNEKRGAFWQNITGSVEKNEDFLTAALRELAEETGIKPVPSLLQALDLEFNFVDRFARQVQEKAFWYHSPAITESIDLDPMEHQQYHWQSLAETTMNDYRFPSNFQCCERVQQIIAETWP